MKNTGVIYILTNPSFPEYVKIGYADDVDRRLKELNRSECTPFVFRLYAYYEVATWSSDIKLHEMIDKLNLNLRSIDDKISKIRNGNTTLLSFDFSDSINELMKYLKSVNIINKNEIRKDKIYIAYNRAKIKNILYILIKETSRQLTRGSFYILIIWEVLASIIFIEYLSFNILCYLLLSNLSFILIPAKVSIAELIWCSRGHSHNALISYPLAR